MVAVTWGRQYEDVEYALATEQRVVKELREEIAALKEQLSTTLTDLRMADAIRAQLVAAVREAASVSDASQAQSKKMRAIVDRAEHLYEDLNDTARHFALHEAIETWQRIKPS